MGTRFPMFLTGAALCLSTALGSFAAPPLGAQSERLAIHVYSLESRAGLEDASLERFRQEIGRFGETHLEFVWMDTNAEARVQFLGRGELSLQLSDDGDRAPEILWTPNPEDERSWAVVRIHSFAKAFQSRGNGARSVSRLAKDVSDWLARNSKAIKIK